MSRMPSRHDEGAYNTSNLSDYGRGFVHGFEEAIEYVKNNGKYTVIDEDSLVEKIKAEVIDLHIDSLVFDMECQADTINCYLIKNATSDEDGDE